MKIEAPLRACLIIDNSFKVPAWQAKALELALKKETLEVTTLLQCRNTRHKRNLIKNLFYYLIRTLVMRPKAWRLTDIRSVIDQNTNVLSFDSTYEGNWQRIPSNTLKELKDLEIDVCVKFGMGLLKDADDFPSRYGILSYHHGDPSKYRGRPAGFYEVYTNEECVGAIVQKITDKLDAGSVFSFGQYKIYPYSYKQTLNSLYMGSSNLLYKATLNIKNNRTIRRSVEGKNYRLPSNLKACDFLLKILMRKIKRLTYGLFFEKRWEVATSTAPVNLFQSESISISEYKTYPTPQGYSFLADSYFSQSQPGIFYAEGMNKKTGKGEILKATLSEVGKFEKLSLNTEAHYSYPFTFSENSKEFIVPEIATHSSPVAFEIGDDNKFSAHTLRGLEHTRVIDPTVVFFNAMYWIFGVCPDSKDQLRVWYSDSFYGAYSEHALNPVVSDPSLARPGGRILVKDGKLFRFGQNNARDYGQGLKLCRIDTLTTAEYQETPVANISVRGKKGPHTLDIKDGVVLFDCYKDQLNPLAFVQRIKNRI